MSATTFQSVLDMKLEKKAKRDSIRFAAIMTVFVIVGLISSAGVAYAGFSTGFTFLGGTGIGAAVVLIGALGFVYYDTFHTLRK